MADHDINNTSTNTQLKGDSLNISEQRKQELKQLFPGVFTETKTDDGKLVESIDFERLKAEPGQFSEIYDNRRERYAMDWPGKKDTLRQIQEPSRATLKPCREESVDFDTTENLFIEGDNLEVLKLLQKSYYGAVKMIYIDPPYNTGKEFIYPDNFTESLDTYLEYAGLKEVGGEGRKFSTNSQNEGRFHSKWLNMMYPRLYLARNLLREDGVIFISIDDNEVENLRRICDEIFGEENFVAQNVWQKRYSRENRGMVGDAHEYILVYAKKFEAFKNVSNLVSITESQRKAYRNPTNDPKGDWRAIPMTAQGYRPNQMYEVVSPTGKVFLPPEGRCWGMIESEYLKQKEEGRVYFGKDGNSQPGIIRYLSEVKGVVPWTWWPHEEAGHTDEAKKEIRAFLGNSQVFDTPKPIKLLKRILEISTRKGDIVLDFFSGSGTTGHAIFDENLNKNSDLKFILVQLPEMINIDSEAFKLGFSNVSHIAKERLRRAGAKIRAEREGQLDLANQQNLDLGFKVFKLDQSNFNQWQAPSKDTSNDELVRQMELHIDPVDHDASQEDLLFEILLKIGIAPTEQIEVLELAGHPIYSVSDGMILIHLEKHTDQALIDAVLDQQPTQFICLDSAFHGNEQMKANAVKSFATFNQEKVGIDRIDFKTV
ncbi:site-specific DNA-methyltransferase [Marinomonas sp.]|uniref:site-specific DNA-methyltransferase n=1 Tax=Marinomonas sp. TaxID=1904862 RepID=UPI003BA8DA98